MNIFYPTKGPTLTFRTYFFITHEVDLWVVIGLVWWDLVVVTVLVDGTVFVLGLVGFGLWTGIYPVEQVSMIGRFNTQSVAV